MPDMTIEIGGRSFVVACQEGEESYLQSAADLLNREAQTLSSAGGRLTQDRMLLMAGLMLADKTLSAEEELRTMDRRVAQQAQVIDELRAHHVAAEVPDAALEKADALAARAEALAARLAE